MSDFKFITKRIPRIEGKALGLGRPVYMADQVRPGTLIVKAIHCPYPFAEVESLDSHIAEKVPGFVRLFTWQDTNIITNFGWNYTPFERNVLNRVGRYEGDVVALVAAAVLLRCLGPPLSALWPWSTART